jgi:hypothetical protein
LCNGSSGVLNYICGVMVVVFVKLHLWCNGSSVVLNYICGVMVVVLC